MSLFLFRGFLFIHVKLLCFIKLLAYNHLIIYLRVRIYFNSHFRHQPLYLQGKFASLHRTVGWVNSRVSLGVVEKSIAGVSTDIKLRYRGCPGWTPSLIRKELFPALSIYIRIILFFFSFYFSFYKQFIFQLRILWALNLLDKPQVFASSPLS
jgi:hypothetical protein